MKQESLIRTNKNVKAEIKGEENERIRIKVWM